MARKNDIKAWAPALAIVLIVAAAVAAERWLIPRPEEPRLARPAERAEKPEPMPPTIAQAPPNPSTWPLYHGGPGLTGATNATVPDRPDLLWQYFANGPIFQPPVSDEQGIYVATRSGTVVALDFEGNERWTRTLEDGSNDRIEAPLTCLRSTVLAGTRTGTIHALDAGDGSERWTYSVGGTLLGAIAFHAPADPAEPVRVFAIRQDDGRVHGIDFDTGRALWQSAATDRCDGSPAVGDGFVVFGNCLATLYVLAATDGALLRSIDLGPDCQVASGPAVVGDEIYSGSRCDRLVRADARTGRIVWSNADSRKEVFTTPAITEGWVVFGAEDGGVYALDRTSGQRQWRFDSGGAPASPVIAGDRVIVSSDGVLHILELDTGRPLWEYEVSDGITSPAIVNGMVVVGSEDGTVAAFGAKDS